MTSEIPKIPTRHLRLFIMDLLCSRGEYNKWYDISEKEWTVALLQGGAQYNATKIIDNFLADDTMVIFEYDSLFTKKTKKEFEEIQKLKNKNGNKNGGKIIRYICLNDTISGKCYDKKLNNSDPYIIDATSALFNNPFWKKENTLAVFASSQKFFGIPGITIVCYKKNKLVNKNSFISLNTFALPNIYNTPIFFPIYSMKILLIKRNKYGNIEYFYKQNKIIYEYINREISKLKKIKIQNSPFNSIHTIVLEFSKEFEASIARKMFRNNGAVVLKANKNLSLRFGLLSITNFKQAKKIVNI